MDLSGCELKRESMLFWPVPVKPAQPRGEARCVFALASRPRGHSLNLGWLGLMSGGRTTTEKRASCYREIPYFIKGMIDVH